MELVNMLEVKGQKSFRLLNSIHELIKSSEHSDLEKEFAQ